MKVLAFICFLFLSVNVFAQTDTLKGEWASLLSIPKSSNPIIIIDGGPSEIALDTIKSHVNNIVDIQVLNKTSAMKIYGNSAKDGAVIITTKNYYINHTEDELYYRSKKYRRYSKKANDHIGYKINNTVLKGTRYETSKQIFDIPQKDIIKIHIKQIHNTGVDSLLVTIKTKM